jgi:predicted negative regulator of RcsB-dependent stress response
MADYETDDEKVEAIKKWWKDNGLSVVAGVAIGLAAVFGWRAWVSHREGVGQQASAAFEQLMVAAEGPDRAGALAQAQAIRQSFGGSAYASLADFMEAKVKLKDGDPSGAVAALQRVMDQAPDPALGRIAALRLARIVLDQGDLERASAIAGKYAADSGAFSGDFAAIQGDVAAAQGRVADARAAYERAIAAGASLTQLLRLKLDNLPAAG